MHGSYYRESRECDACQLMEQTASNDYYPPQATFTQAESLNQGLFFAALLGLGVLSLIALFVEKGIMVSDGVKK